MEQGGAAGAAHGDAATADTIGCQSCHNATVAVEFNDQNNVCATCHDGGTAPLQGNMAINAAGSTHVNGLKDVVFADLSTFKSKARRRASPAGPAPTCRATTASPRRPGAPGSRATAGPATPSCRSNAGPGAMTQSGRFTRHAAG